MTIDFSSQEKKYLDVQMKKVSRSFALVVYYLEQPLKEQLATAYLICRVVDNIEDCTESHAWKRRRFDEFAALLDDPSQAKEVLSLWSAEAWPGLTGDERKLLGLEDGHLLWRIYGQMPGSVRETTHFWVSDMAVGMGKIEDPQASPILVSRDGVRILSSARDYDRYCYFVAGTVGHLATDLAVAYYGLPPATAEALEATCEACGRGLQKTNIVKDFAKDVTRGVSYVPDEWLASAGYGPLHLEGASADWKRMVLGNVFDELREATEYVLALPYDAAGFRIASLLCLFPAYQTLLQAAERQAQLFTARHQVKISRMTMAHCIKDARAMVDDNDGVLTYSRAAERIFKGIFAVAQP